MLESKINHSWVDPRSVKDDESLLYEYKMAYALAQACNEILEFVDQMASQEKYLVAKQKGEIVNKFKIGGEQ